jgi:hypothetical protein
MNDLSILRHILNDPTYEVGDKIKSPIPLVYRGNNDDTTSFSTKYYEYEGEQRVRWRDFGYTPSPLGYDMVALYCYVAEFYDPSWIKPPNWKKKDGRPDREAAYKAIKAEKFEIYSPCSADLINSIKEPITFKKMKLTAAHLNYWSRLGVTWQLLRRFKVSGLEGLYRGPKKLWGTKRNNIGFHYQLRNNDKCYRPFNLNWKGKKSKYLHQGENLVPEGYDQLPKTGKLLIFTKSMKDVLFLTSLGYNAISGGSESMYELILPYVDNLSSRFEDMVFWGDPDAQGIRYSEELKKMFGKGRIAQSVIAKDPTDIWIETGDANIIHMVIKKAA